MASSRSRRRGKHFISDAARNLAHLREQFVRIVGKPVAWGIEEHADPRRIDHVWIKIEAGEVGVIKISLNTLSSKNRDAGYDGRVRVGTLLSSWSELPRAGLARKELFNYADVERQEQIIYNPIDDVALQSLLIEKAKRATLIEAWGDLFIRPDPGLHQVHSRRASSAVPKDIIGRDGAIQFYYPDGRCELMMMKFAGQM